MDDFFDNVTATATALERAFDTITAAADRMMPRSGAGAAAVVDADIGGHGDLHDVDAYDSGTTEEGSDVESAGDFLGFLLSLTRA